MAAFEPKLSILPPAQRRLWDELHATPGHFTLYGGTALALRLGHRTSVDFDFFSNLAFDPDDLFRAVPYVRGSELVRVAPDTLTCRKNGVLVSFFGGLGLGKVADADIASGVAVASLLDLAGTKVAVVQKRAEAKDYIDIDALLLAGIEIGTMLGAGAAIYGRQFNPLISLKALSYFGDLPSLAESTRVRIRGAVAATDPTRLPVLNAVAPRTDGAS